MVDTYHAIPTSLRAVNQWIHWRYVTIKSGPSKVPFDANVCSASKAAVDNPRTWSDFERAIRLQEYHVGRKERVGIGFVFTAGDPFCGIDLDSCIAADGEIAPWAESILDSLRGRAYAEISPSGTGVKLFVRATARRSFNAKINPVTGEAADRSQKSNGKAPGIECYSTLRYFCITGQLFQDFTEIGDAQDVVDQLVDKYSVEPPAAAAAAQPAASRPKRSRRDPGITDVERARRYVAKMPEAIEGNRGSDALFAVTIAVRRGFSLSHEDTMSLLREYNERCVPPTWTEKELVHKINQADIHATQEPGYLLNKPLDKYGSQLKSSGDDSADDSEVELPTIELELDEMRVVEEIIFALGNRRNLYQHGSCLVEIRDSPEPPPCIKRPEGGVRFVAFNKWRLRELITASAKFKKLKKVKEDFEWVDASVPQQPIVEEVAARGLWRGIDTLEGIVSAPQFLADGNVLSSRGYDARSGLFFETEHNTTFPPVPASPSRDDAIAASAELLDVICDFPMDDTSKSSWLALVLTGAARYAIGGPTPLFAIDANTRGTGKSLLADAAGIIHSGRELPRTTWTSDNGETRKMITSVLLSGEPEVLLDNIAGTVGNPPLDAVLTATLWTDRILGASEMTAKLPATTIWTCSGNNLSFAADTARRALRIRLESPDENPEERTGFKHPALLQWVRQNRGRLATAAVTILRAWHVAGRPDMSIPAWGSFDEWSNLIRNAIVWCGLADPGASRQEVQRESDKEAILLRQIIGAWQEADESGHGMTVAEAFKRSEQNEGLAAIFTELSGPNGKVNMRSFGMKLSHLRKRVCCGQSLDSRPTNKGSVWFINSTQSTISNPDYDPQSNLFSQDHPTQISDTRASSDTKNSPPYTRAHAGASVPTHAHTPTHTRTVDSSVTGYSSVTNHDGDSGFTCNHVWQEITTTAGVERWCKLCNQFGELVSDGEL